VATTLHLIEAYTHGDAFTPDHKELGAQKTGAVWQTCSVILDKKLPMGNRNAMRRDLLTYIMECQETMDEFQEMIDLGPSIGMNQDADEPASAEDQGNKGESFEEFINGQNDQYSTSKELALAEAVLTLVKLSRGTIKLSLQALDAVGEELKESSMASEEGRPGKAEQKARLQWIRSLHEECCSVGEGMTDLGTTLYPPLKISDVVSQSRKMINRLETILNHVLDASITIQEEDDGTETGHLFSFDLHIDVMTMADKLKNALLKRKNEVRSALSVMGSSLDEK
jgi:hypothetical protein